MKNALILSFLLITNFAILQHGIDSDWYQNLKEIPKFNSSLNASGAVANNMIVDKSGRVLIFYSEEIGTQLVHYFTGSSDNGNNWNNPAPTLFDPSIITAGNSTLSVDLDTNNIIHAIWSSRITKAVYYSKASATNFSWSNATIIGTTTKTKIGFCQISTDRKMRLHAYWNEGGPGSTETAEVFYTQSINGGNTWMNPLMLSEGENKHSAFPSGDFYGVKGDTLAIAWRDSISPGSSVQDWDIKMVTSANGGVSWSNPFTVVGGAGMQSDPSVVVDKNGIIHMAYHEYPIPGGTLSSRVFYGYSLDLGQTWNSGSFVQISEANIQSHLVKEAYDFENDIVWYFFKDQRDYIMPLDKRADVMAINIQNNGQQISDPEFISDADSNEVGFHNFKVGMDGVPRAHFFIIPYGTDSTTLYYTQRNNFVTLDEYLLEYQNLQIYPNPVSNQLIIKLENETIDYVTIFDSSGKIVNKIKKNEFSVSNLDEGIYFIEIEFANKKIRTKFLKN